jgi:hypothetical protein
MSNNVEFKKFDNDHWYMGFKLPDEIISYLWDCVDRAEKENVDHRRDLAGNISRSLGMKDDKNIMIDTVFAGLFDSDLKGIFIRRIEKAFSQVYTKDQVFGKPADPVLGPLWVNFQKKYEFNPLHNHSGMFSFVIWMKIPYDWRDEKELPWVKGSNSEETVGNFVLVDPSMSNHAFFMDKTMEGHCVFFPSNFYHMVYPFYTSDEERVSISGNIFFELEQ